MKSFIRNNGFKRSHIATALSCAVAMSCLAGATNKNFGAEKLGSVGVKEGTEKQRFIIKLKDQTFRSLSKFNQDPLALKQAKVQLLNDTAKKYNTNVIRALDVQNAMAVVLSDKQKRALENDQSVEYVEIDPKRYLMAESTPYGITMVQANQLSDNQASNQKVCIMDTGYTLNHPDLINSGVTGDDGYGSNDTGNWYNDGNGHGTHVAGTIAAIGGNGQGVVGVNPSGTLGLHIVKVFNDSGSWAYGSDLVEAINQCKRAGASVISMSLGGSGSSATERAAFDSANSSGILSIAAAGNSGDSSMSYPASYNAVMSVAAVDSSGNKASFSQYNSQVEIAAPGVGVQSTYNDNGYKSLSGTSMATPHVAGVAALVWSHYPNCSNQQIRDALNSTAQDKGSAGRDTSYGYGIVKAKDAYDYLKNAGCGGSTNLPPKAGFSSSVNGNTATFSDSSTDDQGVVSHSWNFGDGNSSTSRSPSHTYSASGSYSVTLTVKDAAGLSDSTTQTVSIGDVSLPCDGLSAWSASKSYKVGDKVSYKGNKYTATWWSTGASPDVYSQVWKNDGKCDGDGGDNQAPKASFTYSANKLSVSFSNQSTDDKGVVSYSWDFGDGRSSSSSSPSHTYATAGSYQVTLTVTDGDNLSDTASESVSVSDDVQGCSGVPTWDANTVYLNGDTVAINGKKYRANWWTRGENPEQNSGQWSVWTSLGACQ